MTTSILQRLDRVSVPAVKPDGITMMEHIEIRSNVECAKDCIGDAISHLEEVQAELAVMVCADPSGMSPSTITLKHLERKVRRVLDLFR